MLKLRSIPLAAFWLAAFPVLATAATFNVSVVDNSFSPSVVTIDVGDTVRWTNASGGNSHDVTADDNSFSNPEGTVPSFTYSRTFNSVDDIRYYCTRHGSTGGGGMSGRVVVVESSWSWNFGDGGMSSTQNPGHTYAAAGTFAVKLTVTDNDGAADSQNSNVTVTAPSAEPFLINTAISDAWFFPGTNGQGFFIIVWEGSKFIFLSWFTYDTERPPEDVLAMLGEPGHRWLTAQGPYDGDTATLDVFVSSGGTFDSADPEVITVQDGTITIKWTGCNSGILTYNIPSLGLMGEIPIERIVLDNVPACEAAQP